MRVMRISDTERGAIWLLNVTAELHQSFTSVKQNTAEANILPSGRTFPQFTVIFTVGLVMEVFTLIT